MYPETEAFAIDGRCSDNRHARIGAKTHGAMQTRR